MTKLKLNFAKYIYNRCSIWFNSGCISMSAIFVQRVNNEIKDPLLFA